MICALSAFFDEAHGKTAKMPFDECVKTWYHHAVPGKIRSDRWTAKFILPFWRQGHAPSLKKRGNGTRREPGPDIVISIPSAKRQEGCSIFSGGDAYGNACCCAGGHRPRGKLRPAAQRAAASIRAVHHWAHGCAVPRKRREYHQRGARCAGRCDLGALGQARPARRHHGEDRLRPRRQYRKGRNQ